jgi:hemoglobin
MNAARTVVVSVCVSAVCLGGTACRHRLRMQETGPATVMGPGPNQRSLYDRLGGEDVIRNLVNEATERVLRNADVNFRRQGTSREWHDSPSTTDRFRGRLTDYLVSMTGGPAAYHGPTMLEVHHRMRITDREYDAFMADFADAVRSRGIDPAEGQEVVRILEGLRGDIVEVR